MPTNFPRLIVTGLASLLLASACAKKDSDKISEAQDCLDKATSSTALLCMEKVSGVESEAADLIRCSSIFVYEEFASPAKLANISDQLKTPGAHSPTTAIGLLSFSKPDNGGAQSDAYSAKALDYCTKAKSKGMTLLASMARISTSLAAALGGTTIVDACSGATTTGCQAAVTSAACSAPPAVVGAAALAAYQQSCATGSQSASSVCTQFAAASANGTLGAAAVGTAVQTNLHGGSACP